METAMGFEPMMDGISIASVQGRLLRPLGHTVSYLTPILD
jgi:hypothetical protein